MCCGHVYTWMEFCSSAESVRRRQLVYDLISVHIAKWWNDLSIDNLVILLKIDWRCSHPWTMPNEMKHGTFATISEHCIWSRHNKALSLTINVVEIFLDERRKGTQGSVITTWHGYFWWFVKDLVTNSKTQVNNIQKCWNIANKDGAFG